MQVPSSKIFVLAAKKPLWQIESFRSKFLAGVSLFLFALASTGFAQNQDPPPCDPLNPPASATVPNLPGIWVLGPAPSGASSGDLRAHEYANDDPRGGPVWLECLKSQGFFFWDKVFYLRGRVGGSYNDLEAGNYKWYTETDRDTGVTGTFKLSVSKYGYPKQSFSYAQTVGHPPQPNSLGILSTDQSWWIELRVRIPAVTWDYYNNMYVFSGYYYDWDTAVGVTTPVSKWYYRYQP